MRLLLLFCFIFCSTNYAQNSNLIINDTIKRVVFLGNSITYQGDYITFIETYLKIKYPKNKLEIINVGLPSETVSGLSEVNHANGQFPRPDLHERLDRILQKTKPDLIFACYGMNDGIYLPFDENRFQKFKEGIHWLHQKAIENNSAIVHVTPPIYDPKKGEAYANVLDIYANWLISKQYTNNWQVIDLHFPMKSYLNKMRLQNDDFFIAEDGVHPNKNGHWLMAKSILLYLGESSLETVSNFFDTVQYQNNNLNIYLLMDKKNKMLKDAWLTEIGHKRPKMKKGLTIQKAIQRQKIYQKQIDSLIN